jgi:hypothetical protein
MNYYDWMNADHTCKACGWVGKGSEASIGEVYDDGAEYLCPACQDKLGVVYNATIEETQSDPRAPDTDKAIGQIMSSFQKRFGESCLKSADQLPDLDPGPESLIWMVVGGGSGVWDTDVVILHGDQEIWRELNAWENHSRFEEVACILWDKYGQTLRDLEPHENSMVILCGDSLSALDYLNWVRGMLSQGKRPEHRQNPIIPTF